MNYSAMNDAVLFGYSAFYQLGEKNEHQFAACYNPATPKENFFLSYLHKPSNRLSLFTELKGKTESYVPTQTDYTSGFRMKFSEGMITGYMSSKLKAYATYMKQLEGGMGKLEVNTMIDFKAKTGK